MKLALISDTHGLHRKLGIPPVDVLIHAGDFSFDPSSFEQTREILIWLAAQPTKHKILVPGNHDSHCWYRPGDAHEMAKKLGVHLLIDERVEIDGMKLWGSPYAPFCGAMAFMEERGEAIRRHWNLIPEDTDILITHGPPRGIGDRNEAGENVGCDDLLERVLQVKPKAHIFGHIHAGRGAYRRDGIDFFNVASLSQYGLMSPVIVEVL